MQNALLLLSMLFQFASQTFHIGFSDKDFILNKEASRIKIQSVLNTQDVRVPNFYDIPVVIRHFYFDKKPTKIRILNYSYSKMFKNVKIDKAPQPVPFSIKTPFRYKYPGMGIRVQYPAYLADVRKKDGKFIANVVIFPFRYDEKEKILFILDSCDFQFDLEEAPGKIKGLNEKPLYLIVSSFSILHGFDTLALWKKQKGYRVKMLSMEDISSSFPGRDDAEKLRNALKEYYADSGLLYVLLGGDVDIVPARVSYAMTCEAGFESDEDSIRADLYYSDLDGSWDFDQDGTFGEVEDSVDLYPDVYVGRVPVDNIEQAYDFSRKLINYEQHPTQRAQDALFFAMVLWQDPYTNSGEGKDYIDSVFMPSYYNITKLYEANGNETHASVMSALKQGYGILNHDGHGWWTGMWLNGNPTWEYLSNDDADTIKMAFSGILYSIGCWVGAFDKNDAIAEHLLLNPDGPVAVIANSRYGWGSPGNPLYGYSDKFDQNFYHKIFDDSIFHIGMTLAEDKSDFVPLSHWKNVYRWHQYEVNLFGDPEMEIHTGYEGEILTDFPSAITSNGRVAFSVFNSAGKGLYDAKVSLSYGDSVYAFSKTDYAGHGVFQLAQSLPDSLLLTIYARNYETLKKWVYVAPLVLLEDIKICGQDSATYLFPKDSGNLTIEMKNLTDTSISSFYVRVHSDELMLSLDSFFIEDTILPDSSFDIVSAFSVPSSLTEGDSIKLSVQTPWWDRVFKWRIEKPHVLLRPMPLDSVEIGHNTTFGAILKNPFSYDLGNVCVYIQSVSGIIPDEDSIFVGLLKGHDSVYLSFNGTMYDSMASITFNIKNSSYLDDTACVYYNLSAREYHFDFETPLSGFYITGKWKRTQVRSHSGSYSVWCGDSGHYENNAHDTLITPWIKTSYSPTLSFYMWYDAAIYGTDGIHIYYYAQNSWRELDYIGSGGALDEKGIIVGWSQYNYALDGLNANDSTKIMFVLSTDDSITSEGFYIDDISIKSNAYSTNYNEIPYNSYITLPTILKGNNLTIMYNLECTPQIDIYNIQGRKVISMRPKNKFGKIDIDLKNLSAGLYFVHIGYNHKKMIKKVVLIK